MPSSGIIEQEPAYLLHHRPYSETSQIINLFTQKYGRVDLIAKGSKRPKSKFKSFLQPFLPIRVSWSGRSQLKTLREIEVTGVYIEKIKGKHLMSAFYLNELILSFLTVADPYPDLFTDYSSAITELSDASNIEIALRKFELSMLSEIGYAINFDTEAMSSKNIQKEERYIFYPEQGFRLVNDSSNTKIIIKGSEIKAIKNQDFSSPNTLKAAKKILRLAIDHHLDGKELNSKKVFQSITSKKKTN